MDREDELLVHRATAPGVGGVAVVEILGPGADAALAARFSGPRGGLPRAGRVRLGVLVDEAGEPIDDVTVRRIGASESWCRLEGWVVTCHGGPAVTERVLRAFVATGARRVTTAELLEAARAAGALDIIDVEARRCLIAAFTERAACYGTGQLNGGLARRLAAARDRFVAAPGERPAVIEDLERMLRDALQARRLFEPLRVLVAGRVNVGKSTLFNRLFGQERVVTASVPGTTRDLVEEMIAIAGYPVVLIDSAGLRPEHAADEIEREGIRRALAARRDATLLLTDRDGEPGVEEREFIERAPSRSVLVVRTKIDARASRLVAPPAWRARAVAGGVAASAATGEGLDGLRDALRACWLGPADHEEIPALPFTERLVELVAGCRDAARAALDELDADPSNNSAALDGFRRAFLQYPTAV